MATIPAPVAPPQNPLPPTMEEFVDGLIAKRGYPANLDEQVKKEIHNDAIERLNNFLIDQIMAALPDPAAEEFVRMVESDRSEEEINEYLREHINNYDVFVTNSFRKFTDLYLK